jgi:hypothetical protein
VNMNNAAPGILRRVALVRTDVSDECISSFISMTKISVLQTTMAVNAEEKFLCR